VWVVVAGEQVFKVDPDNGRKTPFAAGPNPVDIAVGDGTLWALDQSGSIQGFDVRSGGAQRGPIDVATGENAEITLGSGALWHGAQGSREFTRIDLETREVQEIALPSGYVDMGVGQGEVWVLMDGGEDYGSFVSLDPESGAAGGTVYSVSGAPVDIAVGKQALWIVNGTGSRALRVEKSSLAG
jgi:streptogramin lyase